MNSNTTESVMITPAKKRAASLFNRIRDLFADQEPGWEDAVIKELAITIRQAELDNLLACREQIEDALDRVIHGGD